MKAKLQQEWIRTSFWENILELSWAAGLAFHTELLKSLPETFPGSPPRTQQRWRSSFQRAVTPTKASTRAGGQGPPHDTVPFLFPVFFFFLKAAVPRLRSPYNNYSTSHLTMEREHGFDHESQI